MPGILGRWLPQTPLPSEPPRLGGRLSQVQMRMFLHHSMLQIDPVPVTLIQMKRNGRIRAVPTAYLGWDDPELDRSPMSR
jgi:hypothetical protein